MFDLVSPPVYPAKRSSLHVVFHRTQHFFGGHSQHSALFFGVPTATAIVPATKICMRCTVPRRALTLFVPSALGKLVSLPFLFFSGGPCSPHLPHAVLSTAVYSTRPPHPTIFPNDQLPITWLNEACGAKRVCEDETDAPTPRVPSVPSLKRAKPDREGPPIEETRKRNEEAENVKTNDQVMGLFEHLTKLTDENPEFAEAASNALDVILCTCPTAPEMDDSTAAPSLNFGDLQPMSPSHPVGEDIFEDFIDYSALSIR